MSNWTHDDLSRDLAEHLAANPRLMIWEDMQLGPSGSARPDVYTIAKSYVRPKKLAYECKISVSDFRSDVTSGKWSSYLKFADGLYFAVPQGLVDKKQVPEHCGLMVRFEKVWRTVKRATLNPVRDLHHDVWLKLLINGIDREYSRRLPEPRKLSVWSAEKKLRKKFGDRVADILRDEDAAEARVRMMENNIKLRRELLENDIAKMRDSAKYAEGEAVKALEEHLGIKINGQYNVYHAVRDAVKRLDRDAELRRLREHLNSIARIATTATTTETR